MMSEGREFGRSGLSLSDLCSSDVHDATNIELRICLAGAHDWRVYYYTRLDHIVQSRVRITIIGGDCYLNCE